MDGDKSLWPSFSGDPIVDISIDVTAHTLCFDFLCVLSSVIAHAGDVVNTGDVIAACAAEGEDLPCPRDSASTTCGNFTGRCFPYRGCDRYAKQTHAGRRRYRCRAELSPACYARRRPAGSHGLNWQPPLRSTEDS